MKRSAWHLYAAALPVVLIFVFLLRMNASAAPDTDTSQQSDEAESQLKQLQKEFEELQKAISAVQLPFILAAGTAAWTMPEIQDNKSYVRVKLKPPIAEKLGDDFIVLLTCRASAGSSPCFIPLWKKANDGFDVTLADPSVTGGTSTSYPGANRNYQIDWIVVRK